MAALREEVLNSYLSLLLCEYDGISATAERRSASEAIDITVTHANVPSPVPILVEAKIGKTPAKRRQAADQARSRLTNSPRALAFALCYPATLKDTSIDSESTKQALASCNLIFAPVQRIRRPPAWHKGTVADLADSLRNADLSRQRVGDVLEYTIREAAESLFEYGTARLLATALALPKSTEADLRAAPLIASLILSNAALLHHRLRLVPALASIPTLESALSEPNRTVAIVNSAWNAILQIDYHPVFAPARAVLEAIPESRIRKALHQIAENAIAVADELASLRFDHAGPLYHRLLGSARYDGSFYTNNVSALLLARLALPQDATDWSDADSLAKLRIIDPACGTGTLLMAAMHTIRDRHEHETASAAASDLLHLVLVEDVLYGLDINRHGVQLAACNLTLGNPRVDYTSMNLYTMQHGPQPVGGTKAGSLEFLATAKNKRDIASLSVPLPTASGLDAERAEPGAAPTESLTGKFDLVIMNPPFTRNDIRNRQYDYKDRRKLQRREIEVAEFLEGRDQVAFKAIDQTSISTFFSPLADVLLRDSRATLAKVMPTTALTNVAGRPERKFLAERFQIDTIVTSHDPDHVSFSENTSIHESLLIARRPCAERSPTRFISLARMPRDAHEAILLSDLINRRMPLGDWGSEHEWPWPRVREGDWSAALFYNVALAEAVRDLAALAGTALKPAGQLCRIEPEGRRIRDAFDRSPKSDAPWTTPVLWDHPTDIQTSMRAIPDVMATPKPDKERYARKILVKKASRLLIVNRLRTDTVRISACYADQPLLGSAWVPVLPKSRDPIFERALCAWWNSTPGVLTLIHSRAKALDYTRYALKTLRSLLIPDPNVVDIGPLVKAFSKCKAAAMLPWPRMRECPSRAVLDVAAARVVGLDGRAVAKWREQIAREPTVSGRSA